jgi:outer membrane usher protein
VAIDTQNLPVDARIGTDQLIAVPRDGAGVLAHFPVSRFHGASLILVDERGSPLPVGTRVTLQESGAASLVGYDGLIFFDTLAAHNHLRAVFEDRSCAIEVSFDAKQTMTTLGKFVCALAPESQ